MTNEYRVFEEVEIREDGKVFADVEVVYYVKIGNLRESRYYYIYRQLRGKNFRTIKHNKEDVQVFLKDKARKQLHELGLIFK